MRKTRVTAVVVCLFLLFEAGLGTEAWRSKAKALHMLQAMDRFKLGVTSRTEVESELRQLDLVPVSEACSSSAGPCSGIGVELANYPEPSLRAAASILEVIAERISVFRPTYLVANFYFNSDKLAFLEVQFSTDKASIGTMLASAGLGENETTEWRRNHRTGNETFVQVLNPTHHQAASLRLESIFNLGCMTSIRGYNAALELWPSALHYKVPR